MSSTRENHADVEKKKIFHNVYRHVIPILKWYCDIHEKQQNNVKLSRNTTFVAFCWPSFILRSQCVLYYRVCSISRLFLCAINVNESVISITSPRTRYGKLTVRYCYRATDGICTKFQVVLYVDMLSTCQDFFTNMATWIKNLGNSPKQNTNIWNLFCSHDSKWLGVHMELLPRFLTGLYFSSK